MQTDKGGRFKNTKDIAAGGFSNNVITLVVDPSLATVDQFPFEMGKKAAELLIQTIQNKLIKPKTIIKDTKLFVCESTCLFLFSMMHHSYSIGVRDLLELLTHIYFNLYTAYDIPGASKLTIVPFLRITIF